MPAPAKVLAEGKAVGGACRHAGRGLEDCYRLNPRADKAAVYEGWKEMNEYMAKNNMQAVPPSLAPNTKHKANSATEDEEEDTDKAKHDQADTKAEVHDDKAQSADKPAKHGKPEADAHAGDAH